MSRLFQVGKSQGAEAGSDLARGRLQEEMFVKYNEGDESRLFKISQVNELSSILI